MSARGAVGLLLNEALTVAGLHALGVAVLLSVAGDGSHVGHVVALCVGVRGVRGVTSHTWRAGVLLWKRGGGEEARRGTDRRPGGGGVGETQERDGLASAG